MIFLRVWLNPDDDDGDDGDADDDDDDDDDWFEQKPKRCGSMLHPSFLGFATAISRGVTNRRPQDSSPWESLSSN